VITVDVYLLNGHAPSANVGRLVDLYLRSCPGVIVRKTLIQSREDLMRSMSKDRVEHVPCIEVPGEVVAKRKKRRFISDEKEIEQWCKETVRQVDSANRRRG
jgi:hypothetical protein